MENIRKYFKSIRFRMLMMFLVIILFAFLITILTAVRITEDVVIKRSISERQSSLNTVCYSLTLPVALEDSDTVYTLITEYAGKNSGRMIVLDTNYIVMADSASLFNGYFLPYDEAVDVLENNMGSSYGFHKLYNDKTGRQEWISYFAQPLSVNGYNRGVLLFTISAQDIMNALVLLQTRLMILFAAVVVATWIIWRILSRSITKPIIELTNVMRHATAKTFDTRVEIDATGEVAELVDAFNRMGAELSAYDKVRDQFVADASHELKTPLAAIKALAEPVLYCETPPPVDLLLDFMHDINDQVDRLNNIVQDLLQIARDSSKDVVYNMEELDFSEIVTELTRFITPVATKKGLEMILDADAGILITGDRSRIERVVTNLVDNAIKYTDKGSITVTLKRERREVVFSVKDTGIGIPEESLSRLFVRFYRVDKARSRATGGTGLGLSMVEDIVNRHGGNIKVESKLGVGSEFIVRIPARQ